MATVAEPKDNGRPRLGYVPPVKCPQHGAVMRAKTTPNLKDVDGNIVRRTTYYYCPYCTYSDKVVRSSNPQ